MYQWIICFILIAVVCAVYEILRWKQWKHFSHFPSWTSLPLLGNVYRILGSKEHILQCISKISDEVDESGLPFIVWVGLKLFLVVSDPEDMKTLSTACMEKAPQYDIAREWVGDGLVTAPGHIWKKKIKTLAGAFSGQIVHDYQAIFNEQAKAFMGLMKAHVDSGPFETKHIIPKVTLETICHTALGVTDISKTISTEDYYESYIKILEKLIARGLNILMYPQFIYNKTKSYKEYIKHVTVLRNTADEVLKQKKLKSKSEKDDGVTRPRVQSYIDILLNLSQSNADMTDEAVKSEVNTIIFAGQETVATALHFMFLVIGSRRDVQEKMYDEIKDIFGDTKRDVNREDLERMVYCEGVINETLRLYPPVPVVLRKVDTNVQLKHCLLLKGSYCVLNLWGSGRSQRLWGPDALEFRPERWREPTPPLMAFSVGRRACIGKRYAYNFIKTILVHTLQDLVFKSDLKDLKMETDITLKSFAGDSIETKLRDA